MNVCHFFNTKNNPNVKIESKQEKQKDNCDYLTILALKDLADYGMILTVIITRERNINVDLKLSLTFSMGEHIFILSAINGIFII